MLGEHAGYNIYGKHAGDKTHVNRKKNLFAETENKNAILKKIPTLTQSYDKQVSPSMKHPTNASTAKLQGVPDA